MPSHSNRLSDKRGQLVVSLPRNDIELARAAVDAGADVLKVHTNITHASGHEFGSLSENFAVFKEILALGLPVGIVPGNAERMIAPEEHQQLIDLGFAFANVDIAATPTFFLNRDLDYIPSIGGGFTEHNDPCLPHLNDYAGDWIEASGTPLSGHDQTLRLSDLLLLRRTSDVVDRRIIVPSVRRLTPQDVPALFDVENVWALMLGAYVTGSGKDSLGPAVAAFRAALDRLDVA